MPLTLEHLLVRLGADSTEFTKALKRGEKRMKVFADNSRKFGNALSFGLTAPMLAVGGASLKMAMEAQESENLFSVSMGGMADAARAWSEEVGDALKLNSYELRKQVGGWHILFKNMGIGEKQSFELSKALVELGGDMASFYNFTGGAAESSEKLRSIMAGETEVARRLGIDISAAAVKTEAYTSGIARQGAELSETDKLMSRYQIVMRQTAVAQGDLARTLDSPINKLRALKEQGIETAIKFGEALIPTFEAALPTIETIADAVGAAAQAFSSMDPEARKVALGIAGVLVAAGPTTRAVGGLSSAVGSGAGMLREYAKFAQGPIDKTFKLKKVTFKMSSAATKSAGAMKVAAISAKALGGALALGVGVAAYEGTKKLLELTGTYEKMAEALGLGADMSQEFADSLEDDAVIYANTHAAYVELAAALGKTGEEWKITGDHTKDNAKKLAELLPKLQSTQAAMLKQAAATRKAKLETQGLSTAQDQVRAALEKADTATNKLAESMGLLSAETVKTSLAEMVKQYTELKNAGMAGSELVRGFGDDLAEKLRLAKEYGQEIPQGIKDMAQALAKDGHEGLQAIAKDFHDELPRYASLGAEKVASVMAGLSGDIENGLSGGFGRGIEKGVAFGDQQLNAFRERVENTPFKIGLIPDEGVWLRALNDLANGRSPDRTTPTP